MLNGPGISPNAAGRPSRFIIRECQPQDAAGIVDLFGRVYGGTADTDQLRTVRDWHWKYPANPAGYHSVVAECRATQRVMAHVGGIPAQLWYRGSVRPGMQTADHMVDPDLRKGLRKRGLFTRTMRAWIDAFCTRQRTTVAWGFPSRENYRIGQRRFSEYTFIRPVEVLVLEDLQRPGTPDVHTPVVSATSVCDEADALWERCREHVPMAIVRNAQHLRWRYEQHPAQLYTLLVATAPDSSWRGYAVVRDGGLADDVLMIMDWLVAPGDQGASRALITACTKRARERRLGAVVAWFPESTEPHETFLGNGFTSRPTDLRFVAGIWDPMVSLTELRRDFYMTLGDADTW